LQLLHTRLSRLTRAEADAAWEAVLQHRRPERDRKTKALQQAAAFIKNCVPAYDGRETLRQIEDALQ
jgi:hypothetical protein